MQRNDGILGAIGLLLASLVGSPALAQPAAGTNAATEPSTTASDLKPDATQPAGDSPGPAGQASPVAVAPAPSAPSAPAPYAPTPVAASAVPSSSGPATAAPSTPEPAAKSGPVGPAPLESGPTAVKGKWNPTLYGFVELDMIHDSTQSYTGISPGFAPIARPDVYAGQHGRTIFDVRGSRFGFRLAAPEVDHIKVTALIEADFLGNQPATGYAAGNINEYSFSTNPMLRIRHAAMKVETPVVDVLAGQYWQLFGWQPYFFPLSVQIPSYPGEVYSRSPQVRVSHKFGGDPVSLEAAIAAARPPQRNAEYPDGQAGLRFLVGPWKGVLATGFSGPYEQSAGIGVSGVYRKFRVPELAAQPTQRHNQTGKGLSFDALIPVIPGTVKDKGNALTLTGSYSTGTGISDLYNPGPLGGAFAFPTLPVPAGATTAPTWPQDIDNGLVMYDPQGHLHSIDWKMYIVGAQYYLPPSGRVWLGANYGHSESDNLASLGLPAAKIVPKYSFWDAVAFLEVAQPVVVGLEYAQVRQTYGDGVQVKNSRVALSTYFIFY